MPGVAFGHTQDLPGQGEVRLKQTLGSRTVSSAPGSSFQVRAYGIPTIN